MLLTDFNETKNGKVFCRLGGSSFFRWGNCHGSVALCESMPPEEPTKASKGGDVIHDASEVCLSDWLDHKATGSHPGENFATLKKPEWMTDQEWEDALEFAQDHRDVMWEKVFQQSVTGKTYGFETKIMLSDKYDMGGHCDLWVVYIDDRAKRVLHIDDIKSGYIFVDDKENSQTGFYIASFRELFLSHGKDIDYAIGSIYQPKHFPAYRPHKFSLSAIERIKKKAYKAAEAIYGPKTPPLKTGPWCVMCRAQAKCPKYQKDISVISGLDITNPREAMLFKPEEADPKLITQIAMHREALVKIISSSYKYCIQQHELGVGDPETKLVAGVAKRRWDGTLDELKTNLGKHLDQNQIVINKPKMLGIGAVEKALKKALGKEEALEVMTENTIKRASTVKLVDVNDPRPKLENARDLIQDVLNAEDEED